MKRLLFIPIIFLYSTLWAADYARMTPIMAGGGGGTSCSATQQSDTTGTIAGVYINYDATRVYGAQSFTAASSFNIYHVTVKCREVGTVSGNLSMSLCTNNSTPTPDEPTATCTAADNVIDASTCNGTGVLVTFNFATPYAVTSGTRYWMKTAGSWEASTSNYIQLYYNGTGDEISLRSDATPTWAAQDATCYNYYTLSSCP